MLQPKTTIKTEFLGETHIIELSENQTKMLLLGIISGNAAAHMDVMKFLLHSEMYRAKFPDHEEYHTHYDVLADFAEKVALQWEIAENNSSQMAS